jgi:hypothetical protein
MFTRSTLPTLAALVLLACGSVAGAEVFDPRAAPTRQVAHHGLTPLSSGLALRSVGRDSIELGLSASSLLRSGLGAPWPGSVPAAARPGRLSFDRVSDDARAGSSASISLGRLNLNETRHPLLGGPSQAELERELAQLRESINRVRVAPQVSLGMRVKF